MNVVKKVRIKDQLWHMAIHWPQVLFIEQEGDQQEIVLANGDHLIVNQTMEAAHMEMPDLLRAHRSYLINPHRLRGHYYETKTNRLFLLFDNGTKMAIGKGRQYYEEFTAQWTQIQKKSGW
jgi:DNA-binding LytR/AlgR family response regulator